MSQAHPRRSRFKSQCSKRSRLRKLQLLSQKRQSLSKRLKHLLQMSWLLSYRRLRKTKRLKKRRKTLRKSKRRFKLLSPSLQRLSSKRNKKRKMLLDWRSLMTSLKFKNQSKRRLMLSQRMIAQELKTRSQMNPRKRKTRRIKRRTTRILNP